MSDYAKVMSKIFSLGGNEFVTQLIIVSLLFLVFKKRKLFAVRFPVCWGVIIALQWLLPVPAPWLYLEVAGLLYLTVFICFDCSPMKALLYTVCLYGAQFIISEFAYIIALLFVRASGDPGMFSAYYVEMPIVMAVWCALTYGTIIRSLLRRTDFEVEKRYVLIAAAVFVLLAVFVSYYGQQSVWYSIDALLYVRLLSLMFAGGLIIICLLTVRTHSLEVENSVLKQILHKDELRYEQAKLSNEKIRIKYHDLKKFEHEGIVIYDDLKEVEEDSELIMSTYFTGNKALDVALSEKALRCSRENIRFVCTADGKAAQFIAPHHIYSFMNNALVNAIEGLKNVTDPESRELDVMITRRGDMLMIEISNSVADGAKIEFEDGLPITTNQDSAEHGYGVKSMRNVVEIYGGNITFTCENGIFTVLAAIPIPESSE